MNNDFADKAESAADKFADKTKNKSDEFSGKAKEALGGLTGDDQLKGEGKAEALMAKGKDALDSVKNSIQDGSAQEAVKEKFEQVKGAVAEGVDKFQNRKSN
ncbi:CsbD family protein [Helcobacillus massiliensis]|uniref:CsbD family protein n=1 Tax=Helcobacillus massiliensis TaxID=521392 RepID=UPI0025570478|nr:CsbD family protein [Helcobacillus massiliensis]MDK7742223.1 CsbD family protein [Helcobacillus massiliensis]WOO93775.1 CsbD family protein [Helcobacillus massiliensis]